MNTLAGLAGCAVCGSIFHFRYLCMMWSYIQKAPNHSRKRLPVKRFYSGSVSVTEHAEIASWIHRHISDNFRIWHKLTRLLFIFKHFLSFQNPNFAPSTTPNSSRWHGECNIILPVRSTKKWMSITNALTVYWPARGRDVWDFRTSGDREKSPVVSIWQPLAYRVGAQGRQRQNQREFIFIFILTVMEFNNR